MARLELGGALTGHVEFAAQTGAPDALFELGMLRTYNMENISIDKTLLSQSWKC